jgi:hypothetical protein
MYLLVLLFTVFFESLSGWCDPVSTIYSDSDYPISVKIVSRSGSRIRGVTCESTNSSEDAKDAAENPRAPWRKMWSSEQQPFTGDPLTVRVYKSTKRVSFEFEPTKITRNQSRYLVVVIDYADGRRLGQIEWIPDLREELTVNVVVP